MKNNQNLPLETLSLDEIKSLPKERKEELRKKYANQYKNIGEYRVGFVLKLKALFL